MHDSESKPEGVSNSPQSLSYKDLVASSKGELFPGETPRLPAPPMLMFDRVTFVSADGGKYGKGTIIAELDIKRDLWFFQCHFLDDPVMPGCLGLDALWQLTGFFVGWLGYKGKGRALGVGEVKFSGMITQDVKLIRYIVHVKKVSKRSSGKIVISTADGVVEADGKEIYSAKDLKACVFKSEKGNS
jgi:3-hydroxyacyl-[acyl-carrier protein] dehydratase/trans-2-decenoyl-[acyl-carrier protein] isomerase